MVVLPADHIMQDEEEFRRVLRLATWVAYESGKLITIGIQRHAPKQGMGTFSMSMKIGNNRILISRGAFIK